MAEIISEKSIESYLCRQIIALGGLCWKMNVINVRGVPDRLCLLPGGRLIFVEVKRPKGGVLSQWQIKMLFKLKMLGFEAVTVWNKEEVDKLLEV